MGRHGRDKCSPNTLALYAALREAPGRVWRASTAPVCLAFYAGVVSCVTLAGLVLLLLLW
jgi:hypothetical protein